MSDIKLNIKKPLSIIMPVYNGEKYLQAQLESIIKQLIVGDELIISDDFSSDNSISIINQFKDFRVKLYKQKTNIGLNKNIEFLINIAANESIILSDQDDVWLSGRLEVFRELLIRYDLVIDDCKIVDADLNIIADSYRSINKFRDGIFGNIYKCSFLGCCMGLNKSLAIQSTPFPDKLMGHDLCIGLTSILKKSKIKLIDEGGLLYRRHSNTVSVAAVGGAKRNHRSFIAALSRRLIAVFYVVRQYCRFRKI
jgi:glycosyltransferase involved in cell wall biosynthesis